MTYRFSNWLASLTASLGLGILMLMSKVLFSAPIGPEMLFNTTSRFLGIPSVFNLIHQLPWGLDAYAKYVFYGFNYLFYLGLWFAIGWLFLRLMKPIWGFIIYPIASSLLVGCVLMPLQGLGFFGLSEQNFFYPVLPSLLWSLTFGLAFALVLWLVQRIKTQVEVEERRASLKKMTQLLALVSLAPVLRSFTAFAQEAVANLLARIKGLSPEITPTEEHYQVSKNVFNPTVKEQDWQLKFTGMVSNKLSLSLEDLKALPSVERSSTLTCISNSVGGDLIGNSVWTGVLLKDLLELVGVADGASELILKAADNYTDSFVLDAAMREGTIVAYLQNGEPLTVDHGFPARVLVPDIYGMKNVKWVTEIELTNEDYQGYWQTRGWSDLATVQTMSRIDTREATRLEDGSVVIGGVAFAGIRGISKVEVSVDAARTWQEAELKPALNDLSWNLWGFSWQAEPGNYKILVRAADGTGELQTDEKNSPLPDGATGYHSLTVKVS
ncbi:MAG: molybdopterin-dependent oxidoreductase [Trueperaceae bacterium]|nr:molybdopterin-dependent oxidoreductase [Trueperaceae bacterium]